jgi:hypothetical protein
MKDDFFINRLLLPFIKNEQTLPISFVQLAEEKEKKEEDENESWSPNASLLTSDGVTAQLSRPKKIEENSTFAPSDLLSATLRS